MVLEDRVPFYMRVMKYVASLCILFSVLVMLMFSEDSEYQKVCDQRLTCYGYCNNAFFPSLFCQETSDYEIAIQGNIYYKFYKYPDPEYVLKHEVDLAIDNTAAAEARDKKLDKIVPIYKAYQAARQDAIKQKAKYTEEMAKTRKTKTDADNSVAYEELRTTELKIATGALAKDPTSKSLEAAKALAVLEVKAAAENLALKQRTAKLQQQ